MNEKMLMEVIRAQQETIRILQEHIKRLTKPKLDIKFPPMPCFKKLEEGDGTNE